MKEEKRVSLKEIVRKGCLGRNGERQGDAKKERKKMGGGGFGYPARSKIGKR